MKRDFITGVPDLLPMGHICEGASCGPLESYAFGISLHNFIFNIGKTPMFWFTRPGMLSAALGREKVVQQSSQVDPSCC